jgi:hypothetical protein
MIRKRFQKSDEPMFPPGGCIMVPVRQTEQNRVQTDTILGAIDSKLIYKLTNHPKNVLLQPRREPVVLEMFQHRKTSFNIDPKGIKFVIQPMEVIFPTEQNCVQ